MHLKWYLIIISFFALLGALIATLLYKVFFLESLGMMILGILLVVIVDALIATLARLLPRKAADFETKVFKVTRREKKLLDKLQIKKWKDKIPEIGHFTGFRKNQVSEPKNPEYIERFLYEISYGEIGHALSVPLGFILFLLILLPWYQPYWLVLLITICVVNGILNIFPIMVLRYNKYGLLLLHKRLTR